MSIERDSKPDVSPLLRALGQEHAAPRSTKAEDARAALFAARIDQQLADLNRTGRRSKAAAWVALSLAAALPLGWFGVRALRQPRAQLSITREPGTRAEARQSATSASAEPLNAPAQEPARIVGREPKKGLSQTGLAPAPSASIEPSAAPPAASASTLGEENRLFGEAAAAARSGAVDQALSGFEELLRKYPSSPLSQTARVRKFRLLAKSGRKSQAAAEALRYLNSYPTGFAEREAEAIARGEATPGDTPSDEPGSP